MATKKQKMQSLIRLYRDETGESDVDMHKVAKFAAGKSWPLPTPANQLDLLAKEFSAAAREEIKHDQETGQPYRVNHAFRTTQGTQQLMLWVDIDQAPRKKMLKSLTNRREQMVGDGLQLTLDADHWNRVNPEQGQIVMQLDFTDDVEWRKHAPVEDAKAS